MAQRTLAALALVGLALALCHAVAAQGPIHCTCFIDASTQQLYIRMGRDTKEGVAWGYFQDTIETTGFGTLSVTTSAEFSDAHQMACAGFLEGFLTKDRIWQLYQNYANSQSDFSKPEVRRLVKQFLAENSNWTRMQAAIGTANPSTPYYSYWKQVALLLAQFDGLVSAYNTYQPREKYLTPDDLWLLNSVGDLDDIVPAMVRLANIKKFGRNSVPEFDFSEEAVAQADLRSHCSAIIKPVTDGNGRITDIFFSHDMWASYAQMIQIYKHYNFALSTATNKRISMSSYPGFLSSEDDFYILGDTKMAVMETTNNVYNRTLYDLLTPNSLFSWVRVMVSHRTTTSAQDWQRTMSLWNSGTYNNQWMVVDFKLFSPGQTSLPANLLVIGEQLPGYYRIEDVTSVMNKQNYWPSYNVPYFKDGYILSGYDTMRQEKGNAYSYELTPRANIFRARQGSVSDLLSLQKLMRYNDWQNDPLSLGCPKFAMASRYDLTPPGIPLCPLLPMGAINAKITSAIMTSNNMQASVVGGPTHDQQPVFAWTDEISKKFNGTLHIGQPTTFNFDWFIAQPPTA